jgi:hypothetical protein
VQLLPVFVRDVLHLGPRGLGLIMGASGAPWAVTIGALGSSLCVALVALRYRGLARL